MAVYYFARSAVDVLSGAGTADDPFLVDLDAAGDNQIAIWEAGLIAIFAALGEGSPDFVELGSETVLAHGTVEHVGVEGCSGVVEHVACIPSVFEFGGTSFPPDDENGEMYDFALAMEFAGSGGAGVIFGDTSPGGVTPPYTGGGGDTSPGGSDPGTVPWGGPHNNDPGGDTGPGGNTDPGTVPWVPPGSNNDPGGGNTDPGGGGTVPGQVPWGGPIVVRTL